MKKHCILLFFCCLNLLMNTAGAYNLKQVADKEYMSNSSITSLCQDDKGLMWIGTCDGLNIYDGQEIEEFLKLIKACNGVRFTVQTNQAIIGLEPISIVAGIDNIINLIAG